ncbi:MAG: TIGR03617 family F420-dependent LLM class oxidoreductase [Acidimicrobiia bacterium]|nr:TIGR03617 family F420-dependent LLM class oxidoreductase [Acidimicrobiia bacterium]
MTGGRKLRDVQQLARDAEAAGFSGLVLTETGRTAYLSCAAAGLASEKLHIGTGVAVAFPRSPMITAKVAWELADLTGGRFDLGLGTQVRAHIERRYGSEFAHPGPRMREYLLALRAIFAAFQGTEKLDFQGEFYKLSLLPAAWTPGPIEHPNVPLSVAAVGPWMLRMAGEVADAVHVHPFHSTTYLNETVLPTVAEGAAKANRDVADVALYIPVFTIVGDTEEERAPLKELAKSQISFYGSTKNYAGVFDQLGFEGTSAKLNERLKAGDTAGMADLITDEMLEHYAVTSTWDELSDRLVDRYQGTAARLIMYFAERMAQRDPSAMGRWGEVARDVRARG